MPSPEEFIRKMEAEAGKPMPEILKEWSHKNLTNRADRDSYHRRAAACILAEMGTTFE